MPYGLPKEIGGDSTENTAWMENCVRRIMAKEGYPKERAIILCKSTLIKTKGNAELAQDKIDFILESPERQKMSIE